MRLPFESLIDRAADRVDALAEKSRTMKGERLVLLTALGLGAFALYLGTGGFAVHAILSIVGLAASHETVLLYTALMTIGAYSIGAFIGLLKLWGKRK